MSEKYMCENCKAEFSEPADKCGYCGSNKKLVRVGGEETAGAQEGNDNLEMLVLDDGMMELADAGEPSSEEETGDTAGAQPGDSEDKAEEPPKAEAQAGASEGKAEESPKAADEKQTTFDSVQFHTHVSYWFDSLLNALKLKDKGDRLVLLNGASGVGKTQFLLSAALLPSLEEYRAGSAMFADFRPGPNHRRDLQHLCVMAQTLRQNTKFYAFRRAGDMNTMGACYFLDMRGQDTTGPDALDTGRKLLAIPAEYSKHGANRDAVCRAVVHGLLAPKPPRDSMAEMDWMDKQRHLEAFLRICIHSVADGICFLSLLKVEETKTVVPQSDTFRGTYDSTQETGKTLPALQDTTDGMRILQQLHGGSRNLADQILRCRSREDMIGMYADFVAALVSAKESGRGNLERWPDGLFLDQFFYLGLNKSDKYLIMKSPVDPTRQSAASVYRKYEKRQFDSIMERFRRVKIGWLSLATPGMPADMNLATEEEREWVVGYPCPGLEEAFEWMYEQAYDDRPWRHTSTREAYPTSREYFRFLLPF